ncbi:hypothetical protein ACTFIW_007605 [Dictyostelium discoideum]
MKSNGKQLTSTIFPYVAPYLINELNFLEILELSLLSKQNFKIIRNLITYESKELNIVLGRFDQLKLYIQLSFIYNLSYSNYEFKLIQYKDIEYINLKRGNIKIENNNNDYILENSNNNYKDYLLSHCPKLKHIHWIMDISILKSTIGGLTIDYTDNGFTSFDRLILNIDFNNLPYSNTNEIESLQFINTHTLQTENVFNFNFINNFKPRKLIIHDENIGLLYNNIFKLNNLNLKKLKCFRNIIGSSILINSIFNFLNQQIQQVQQEHYSSITSLKSIHINTTSINTTNFIEFKNEIQLIKELIKNQTHNNNNKTLNYLKLKITFNNNNQYINEINSFKNFIDLINNFNFNIIIKIKD